GTNRFAVRSPGTEGRFEAVQLAAIAQDLFHAVKIVVPQERFPPAAGDRPTLALRVAIHVLSGAVHVDPLKIVKVHRIGRGAPTSAESVGIRNLQPERAPAARRMAGEKPGRGGRHGPELTVELGNELFDE